MIKYKKIIKIKHKRNPSESNRKTVSKILDNASFWEYLSEGKNAITYYFVVKNKFKFKNIVLFPGEYVLKYEYDRVYNANIIKELSNLGLIPKIYYIDNLITIMKYFHGKPLENIIPTLSNLEKRTVFNNILKEYDKWVKNKENHGDFHTKNILVDKNLNVCFIDPMPILRVPTNSYDVMHLNRIARKLNINISDKNLDKLRFKNKRFKK